MDTFGSGLLPMLYERYLLRASRLRRWLLSTSVGGIVNGRGMCTTGAGRLRNANLTKTASSLPPPTGFRFFLMVSRSSFFPVW
jgi:hypothetical protein